ncbi:MAG: hypothetical protein NZ700_03635 [Gemmataceae bacterium]|nr:hypothetical protein [Gemmataceae bacterium]MDW8263755.1 hypothetical protein [Gemmataceae bacterium]
MADLTPYQQRVIKRYYDNLDTIKLQRLAELATELYLAEGKKRQRIWDYLVAAMRQLGVSQARIEHLVKQDNPALIAELVKELQARRD